MAAPQPQRGADDPLSAPPDQVVVVVVVVRRPAIAPPEIVDPERVAFQEACRRLLLILLKVSNTSTLFTIPFFFLG